MIKFTALFGLLAVEIAVKMENATARYAIGGTIVAVALVLVYRSFYGMRIPDDPQDDAAAQATLKAN